MFRACETQGLSGLGFTVWFKNVSTQLKLARKTKHQSVYQGTDGACSWAMGSLSYKWVVLALKLRVGVKL